MMSGFFSGLSDGPPGGDVDPAAAAATAASAANAMGGPPSGGAIPDWWDEPADSPFAPGVSKEEHRRMFTAATSFFQAQMASANEEIERNQKRGAGAAAPSTRDTVGDDADDDNDDSQEEEEEEDDGDEDNGSVSDIPSLDSGRSEEESQEDDRAGDSRKRGVPLTDEDEDWASGDEGSNASRDGPPILLSASDSDSEGPDQGGPDQEGPNDPNGFDLYPAMLKSKTVASTSRSAYGLMSFWLDNKASTPPAFINYYDQKVLRGRKLLFEASIVYGSHLPLGFPEFVYFIGELDRAKSRDIARAKLPAGFLGYVRRAMKEKPPHPRPPQKKQLSKQDKDRRAAEQAEKLSGRTKRSVDTKEKQNTDGKAVPTSRTSGSGSLISAKAGVSEERSEDTVECRIRQLMNNDTAARSYANTVSDSLQEQVMSLIEGLRLSNKKNAEWYEKILKKERAALTAARAEAAVLASSAACRGNELTVKEALDKAEALKKQANLILADTRYPGAVEQYTLGIQVLMPYVKPVQVDQRYAMGSDDPKDDGKGQNGKRGGSGDGQDGKGKEQKAAAAAAEEDTDSVAARELQLNLLCNRSLAHLRWGNLGSAKEDAQQAMDIDPHHIKAYFRRAAAHKQAERYRDALSDLRYMLRLEPPPAKGAPVSDHILAVQKMARECEQKVRAKGFKKALEETKTLTPAVSAAKQKQAREKWDASRSNRKKPAKKMPYRPKTKDASAWELGTNSLPPCSEIPTLKNLAAWVAAESIDRAPEVYVAWCEGLLAEYLVSVFERLNWTSIQKMMASGLFDEVGTISSKVQAEHWLAQDKQHRRLYALVQLDDFLEASKALGAEGGKGLADPAVRSLLSSRVLDPHLGLTDVLGNQAFFNHQPWDAEEEATPKLFNFGANRTSGRAVVTRDEFLQQFNVFTEGQLTFMDWNNVVVAGGSVLAATRPPPPGPLRDFYHSLAYRSSDIDVFLYGLNEQAATEKVKQIYAAIQLANPKMFAVRTLHCITFVSEFPLRKVQIVLRLYKTLAEVLHGFDVDACSIGFDGHTVWATNRAARAICKRYNVVEISRRSPSYESRLFKYSKRGHAVLVPGMKVDRIKNNLHPSRINSRDADNQQGLAKLIAMDACYQRFNLTQQWHLYYQRWNEGLVSTVDSHMQEAKRIHRQEHFEASDYTHLFIPYGPKWDRDRTRSHVQDSIRSANTWYFRLNVCNTPQATIQPAVCGGIDYVLDTGVNTGCYEKTRYSPEEDMSLAHMKHVTGDQMWVKVNPGAQGIFRDEDQLLTGSFHPLSSSETEWEMDAYKTTN